MAKTPAEHGVYAIRYAERDGHRRDMFLGGDPPRRADADGLLRTALHRYGGDDRHGHVLLPMMIVAISAGPILIVVATSFTQHDYIAFPPGPLSLRWYGAVLANREFMSSLLVSFEVALAAAAVSLVLGTAAAVALTRLEAPGLGMARVLITSPLALPGLVIAVAILEAISSVRIRPALWVVISGHVLITMPCVVRLATAALQNFDRNIERAALNLGDTRLGAFVRVTVPNILPGVLGGGLLAFIISFEDVNVALFLSSADATTLPVRIFNLLTQESSPIASAADSLLTMIVLTLAFLADRLFGLERAVS